MRFRATTSLDVSSKSNSRLSHRPKTRGNARPPCLRKGDADQRTGHGRFRPLPKLRVSFESRGCPGEGPLSKPLCCGPPPQNSFFFPGRRTPVSILARSKLEWLLNQADSYREMTAAARASWSIKDSAFSPRSPLYKR